MMSEEYSKLIRRSSTSRNMKPLEVWTCQRAENLKKKSSKIPKNNYAATMVSAARRQIIGGGSAPINKSRRWRRPQIVGGAASARLYYAHSSGFKSPIADLLSLEILLCLRSLKTVSQNFVNMVFSGPDVSPNSSLYTAHRILSIMVSACEH